MAEHKPLPNQDLLSLAKLSWLCKPCGSKSIANMTRFSMIMNVMSTTLRPTDSKRSVLDQALIGEKLHDREPELIVKELESRIPGFFASIPRKSDTVSETQKRAFLSDMIRHYVHQGYRKYGKPNLRNGGTDVVIVD